MQCLWSTLYVIMPSSGQLAHNMGKVPRFKVVLLGELGVGKSSLFLRMKDNVFGEGLQPTLGIESCSRSVNVEDVKITLQVWDTAGVERYKTLTMNYYRNTQAVLLVYSVDNPASLHYLSKWVQDVKCTSPNALLFLIGNKCDLDGTIPGESVQDFSSAHDCRSSFTTSAKTGSGIDKALSHIGQTLLDTHAVPEFSDKFRLDTVNTHSGESACGC